MQVREAQIPRELDNGTIGCLVQESMLATENKNKNGASEAILFAG